MCVFAETLQLIALLDYLPAYPQERPKQPQPQHTHQDKGLFNHERFLLFFNVVETNVNLLAFRNNSSSSSSGGGGVSSYLWYFEHGRHQRDKSKSSHGLLRRVPGGRGVKRHEVSGCRGWHHRAPAIPRRATTQRLPRRRGPRPRTSPRNMYISPTGTMK